jgi:nucleotide-binding universal stress UspA family protein
MTMFETILVPLDGSDLAAGALEPAAEIAQLVGARIHLVRVPDLPVHAILDQLPGDIARETDAARAEAEASLAEAAEQLTGKGLSVTTSIQEGPPAQGIAKAVDETGAGLVVLTSHGRGAVARAWLGSTADRLIRTLDVPMLLLRKGEWRKPERILIGLDGSERAEEILAPTIELAKIWKSGLLLVHVVPAPGPKRTGEAGTWLQHQSLVAHRYIHAMALTYRAQGFDVHAQVPVRWDPAQVLQELAATDDVEMLALATRGLGGADRLLLGSVADKVIRGSGLPTLILRPRSEGSSTSRAFRDAAITSPRGVES